MQLNLLWCTGVRPSTQEILDSKHQAGEPPLQTDFCLKTLISIKSQNFQDHSKHTWLWSFSYHLALSKKCTILLVCNMTVLQKVCRKCILSKNYCIKVQTFCTQISLSFNSTFPQTFWSILLYNFKEKQWFSISPTSFTIVHMADIFEWLLDFDSTRWSRFLLMDNFEALLFIPLLHKYQWPMMTGSNGKSTQTFILFFFVFKVY